MLRVLHVIANVAPRYGGPSRAAQDMCRSMAARGHHVELFATNQDGNGVLPGRVGAPISADGYTTTLFDYFGPTGYPISRGLLQALRRRVGDFDVVDIHSVYQFHTLVASAVARRRGVPYIVRPHGTLDRYPSDRHRLRKALYMAVVERRSLDRAAAVHYTSDQERQESEETGLRAPGYVVPLGIDVSEFAQHTSEADLPGAIPRNIPLVTYLGRLAEGKGLTTLAEAFARVLRKGNDAQLVVVGPDNDGLRARLEGRVADLGISSRVTFTGLVTGLHKVAVLQRSRLFVLPSRHENFGAAVVEAMASRVPVVVTKGVAIHPEIAAADAGHVVERTIEGVAEAIGHLLTDDAARERMASAALALARRSYSLEAMGEGLERMYEFVLRNGQGNSEDAT